MSEFKANYLLTPKEVIVDLINKSQRRPTTFTVADLTFEVPQAFDGMKNTSLVIAPTPASGMGWAPRPIFYDRVDLTDFIPELLEFPDATQGFTLRDVLDYVETIKPQVKLVTEDFLEREITVPGSFTLRAKPEALLWKGQINVTVGDVTEEEEEEEERPEIDPNPNPNHPTLTMYAGAGSYREGAEAVVYGSITFDEGRPVPAGQVVISHSGYTENPVVSADLPNGFTLDTTDPASTKIKGFTADTTTGLRNFTLRLNSTAVLGTGDTLANSQTTLTNQIAYDAVNNIHDTAGTTVSYKLLANATPGVELVTQKSVFKPGESFDVKVFINVTENCGNSDDRTYLLKFGPAINYVAFNAESEFLNASEGSEGVEVSLSGGAVKGTYEGTVTLTVSEDLDESLIGITNYGISIEGVHPELDPRSIAIGFEAAGEEEPPVDPEPEVPGDDEDDVVDIDSRLELSASPVYVGSQVGPSLIYTIDIPRDGYMDGRVITVESDVVTGNALYIQQANNVTLPGGFSDAHTATVPDYLDWDLGAEVPGDSFRSIVDSPSGTFEFKFKDGTPAGTYTVEIPLCHPGQQVGEQLVTFSFDNEGTVEEATCEVEFADPALPVLTLESLEPYFTEGSEVELKGSITFPTDYVPSNGHLVIGHVNYADNPLIEFISENDDLYVDSDVDGFGSATVIRGFNSNMSGGTYNFTLKLETPKLLGSGINDRSS